MARKYSLNDLVRWGHIYDYEAKKLIKYGFTDVRYEDRMSSILNEDKNCKYMFTTDRSRRGYMSFTLTRIKPYETIFPKDNRYCHSLWWCIKEYEKLVGDDNAIN